MQTIQSEIREFVTENFLFGAPNTQLANDESFLDGGIIDSTGVLELVGFLEQRFAIPIGDEELVPENLDSIERVAVFVERKLLAKRTSLAG